MGSEEIQQEDHPASVGQLLDLLDLEPLDRDLYRAHNLSPNVRFRLFGGQVAAQALRAATLSVEHDRPPHSLHGYFLRPGRSDRPTILKVDRDRDGRSVSARRVTAVQDGQVIFTLSASFQHPEPGPDWDVGLPAGVPPPADAGSPLQLSGHPSLFEIRPVSEPHLHGLPDVYWARSSTPLPDDPVLHMCVLTYLSDLGVGEGELGSVIADMDRPSVDHAVWFHRPVRLDEWVLFSMRPLSVQAGRCLYTGSFFGQRGVHAATIVQECLLRPRRLRPPATDQKGLGSEPL
jgi:acyl-CoA thioesterase-2